MMEVVQEGYNIGKQVGQVFMSVFYLYLFMLAFDVVTGLLASGKEGKWNSSVSFDGLIKKVGSIVALCFISFLDVYFQVEGQLVKIGLGMLIIYEGLSIIENFSRIGVNLSFLTKYFDQNKIGKGGKK